MAIKIPPVKGKSEFRNELLTFIDPKNIDIDRTMTNLFVLLRYNGSKPRLRPRRASEKIDTARLVQELQDIETANPDKISGAKAYPEAVTWWLRSNLTDLVSRGRETESFATLRPIHLQSFTFRNARHTRDYFTSDQVYSFLNEDGDVKKELTQFLDEGWNGSNVTNNRTIDVDSLGILRLIEQNTTKATDDTENIFDRVRPLLRADAKRYCDDIHRLLQYRQVIPRHVLIEYIKTLTAFHLSLYTIKVVRFLPQMVREGRADIDTTLSLVVDLTDQPNSGAARLATADAQSIYDSTLDYIRATFAVNLSLRNLDLTSTNSTHLAQALRALAHPDDDFLADTRSALRDIERHKDNGSDEQDAIRDIAAYESDDIQRYLAVLVKARGSFYHKYVVQLLDSLMQKNTEGGILVGARTRSGKRRFVLGTKLLEMLVQLCVLTPTETGFRTEPVSIETFLTWLHDRYGLVVSGIDTPNAGPGRFQDADLETHQAFRDNLRAFREKLRQIGFYTVLSDAYIMQKIRPRYALNS